MSQFVRVIDHSIIDFFVQQAEDSRYCRDNLLKDSPYLLCNGELDCLFGNIPKETADSFVIAEAFCDGKDIILQTTQCGSGNLRGKAGALALAESQVGLAILEYHFKSPASGIYTPGLEEIHCGIGCKQSVPFAVLGPAYKEYPYRDTSERGIKHDIVAFELAAVLLQFEFFTEFHKCWSRKVSVFGMVFCLTVLSDLYHAKPMAFDMAAMDELDNLLVGKPTVCQHVAEPYASTDGPLYHLLCKLNLGHVIFLLTLAKRLAVMFRDTTPFEFPGAHAVVPFLSFLSDDGEVEKHLRHSVGDSHTETLKSEHRFVSQMGMDTPDFFNSPACLLMVGIVKNQTHLIGFMVRTEMYSVPQLYRYMPESLSPVYIGIFHKAVENILSGLNQRIKCTVLLIAVCVSNAETWEKKKTLEYSQQPVNTVTLACYCKRVALGHLDLPKYRTYVLHGCCHIGIFEKVFDIREKRSNFVYRHGFELVFWWYLKLLIFLQLGKNPCRFFMPLSQEIITCET